jgi:hypothetical protein
MPGKAEMGEKAQCTWAVHEHFEPIINAAWRRQRVFQQPVKRNRGNPLPIYPENAHPSPRHVMSDHALLEMERT